MPVLLPLLLLAAAQTTPTPKLPPANPLPPPASDEGQVMAPITTLLKAIETSDGPAILSVTLPEGGATVAFDAAKGKRNVYRLSWADYVAGLKDEGGGRFQERIFDPAVEIDGNLAYVWARYTVLKNGAIAHCGYDLFDMVRDNGTWKVLNVTWSQRSTGCTAE